jgi:two-component system nitrogen regulation sensor histidine kinase GlnL
VLILSPDDRIAYVNPSGEQFFALGAPQMQRLALSELVPFGSPIVPLAEEARESSVVMSEYEVDVGSPRIGRRLVNATASPIIERPGFVILTLQENTIASKMDRQLTHRGAARSVTAMAAVLAHEIKNPLSGIRGAAQLIENSVEGEDRVLTQLICDETDRIVGIVERMEMFSDKPVEREPVNIHAVLERVRRIAENGFARNVKFYEQYDPSLPEVHGNFDQLVQVFLNLIKNSSEEVSENNGEITIKTAFRHGISVTVPGTSSRLKLPIEVTIQDNGGGVPEELLPYLFDPFVTTKTKGSGLGLALVAKIVGDHGGIVECEPLDRGTAFRVMLPMTGGV